MILHFTHHHCIYNQYMVTKPLTLRYNYRIYPTPEQEAKLVEFGSYARGVWNLLLSECQRRYAYDGTFLFYNDLATLLKELKVFEEFAWLKAFDSAAAQQVARDLDQALKNAIRKDRIQRFPRYKLSYQKKKQHNDSYRAVNNSNTIRIENGCISLPKVGPVPIKYHRKLPGKLKTGTIRYHHGIWEVSIPVEVQVRKPKVLLSAPVGLDINSQHTLVSSNGWYVPNPQSLKKHESKLKQLQRQLSRRKKGSNRWKNTKQRIQKLHGKIRRQRLDFGHQVSNTIAKCFDLVVFEDLNVKAMQHWNGRMVGDNLMAEIVSLTRYKVQRQGGLVHQINRFAPSTKLCNKCQHEQTMALGERVFVCEKCDHTRCRDWNSAMNIENTGIKELEQAGLACWDSPTVQQKASVKTKVPALVRLDVGSVQRDAA